jgi:hypothetical protein
LFSDGQRMQRSFTAAKNVSTSKSLHTTSR